MLEISSSGIRGTPISIIRLRTEPEPEAVPYQRVRVVRDAEQHEFEVAGLVRDIRETSSACANIARSSAFTLWKLSNDHALKGPLASKRFKSQGPPQTAPR